MRHIPCRPSKSGRTPEKRRNATFSKSSGNTPRQGMTVLSWWRWPPSSNESSANQPLLFYKQKGTSSALTDSHQSWYRVQMFRCSTASASGECPTEDQELDRGWEWGCHWALDQASGCQEDPRSEFEEIQRAGLHDVWECDIIRHHVPVSSKIRESWAQHGRITKWGKHVQTRMLLQHATTQAWASGLGQSFWIIFDSL